MSASPGPPPVRTEKPEFTRRDMVAWFDPRQLIDTATRAGLSVIFGAYADKREVQAALTESPVHEEPAGRDELWIDYIADLGDGWNSTYTMASLLAEESRRFEIGDRGFSTRRGDLLILGGDQVYPTAKPEEYRDRFLGPYKSALPWVTDGDPPDLFAIPGNHDWYDGLTSFTRVFCQQRWIGGWKTRQSRSYFAIRLPHDWWLWGIDIQLGADIDGPQLDYFRKVASGGFDGEPSDDYLAGQKIILCTASPAWIHAAGEDDRAYHNLNHFEEKLITAFGGRLALTLTGDLHHYVRYSDQDGGEKITSGGGGAYLYGTHDLPEAVDLPSFNQRITRTGKPFPGHKVSRKLARRAWRFAFLWKNSRFTALLGGVYLLYSWILQSASKRLASSTGADAETAATFLEDIQHVAFGVDGVARVLTEYIRVIAHSPASLVIPGVIVFGLTKFCDARLGWARWAIGGAHGLSHIALNIGLMWAFAFLNLEVLGWNVDSVLQVILFLVEMMVFGAALGGLLVGLYLVLTNAFFGMHANEVFSAQGISDYKNFLRLHLDKDGGLTVFPIGVRRVVRKWRPKERKTDGDAWWEPDGVSIEAELIEEPIEVN